MLRRRKPRGRPARQILRSRPPTPTATMSTTPKVTCRIRRSRSANLAPLGRRPRARPVSFAARRRLAEAQARASFRRRSVAWAPTSVACAVATAGSTSRRARRTGWTSMSARSRAAPHPRGACCVVTGSVTRHCSIAANFLLHSRAGAGHFPSLVRTSLPPTALASRVPELAACSPGRPPDSRCRVRPTSTERRDATR
jgi:hypothetical protein